jgi:hypothetical protein
MKMHGDELDDRRSKKGVTQEGGQNTYQVLNPLSKKPERLSVKTLEKA